MFVCICHAVSDKTIKQLVNQQGVTSIRELRRLTPLGSQCGKCVRQAKEVIHDQVQVITLQQAS
ncbi:MULTISPECIES: bacterioferritin-associated ferredoxin [Salinivibrio]|uniref:Bacterioferritin-associated ferredoxin n=2 Tax=Salinivibrio TaxID=51366 RepID=A0ABY7LHR2_9GAMM|nr:MULTISPECIES: bacterioferritin-associated ferredoxin [Salinivibrio]ODP96793.1 bacterioferritin [Salinivibrio sp. DV]OOF08348.1 bacterioferritin [Salinivibrio sp. PR5]OOF10781.1 bacterioferritin [Salinivibrio sp. PR919]OOF17340.1 bacterioferritin [Salinivibrio sp. PR932]OOF18415.1 bacterioferritin [Salinivibrio sp. IB574]